MEWDSGYRDGYAKGVNDAVAIINKIGKANITVLEVATELLEQALEDAR